jgi:hypothetical protein
MAIIIIIIISNSFLSFSYFPEFIEPGKRMSRDDGNRKGESISARSSPVHRLKWPNYAAVIIYSTAQAAATLFDRPSRHRSRRDFSFSR